MVEGRRQGETSVPPPNLGRDQGTGLVQGQRVSVIVLDLGPNLGSVTIVKGTITKGIDPIPRTPKRGVVEVKDLAPPPVPNPVPPGGGEGVVVVVIPPQEKVKRGNGSPNPSPLHQMVTPPPIQKRRIRRRAPHPLRDPPQKRKRRRKSQRRAVNIEKIIKNR